jgi:hypothetical protein
MKTKILLIAGLALFLTSLSYGNKEIKKDSLLKALQKEIPNNWNMRIYAQQLIIERIDSIWVLAGNWINAPASQYGTDEDNKKQILEFGKHDQARIVFNIEPKWTKEKFDNHKLLETSDPLPDFNSTNYSLFKQEVVGMDNEFERVYPWEANRETYHVYYKLIRQTLAEL